MRLSFKEHQDIHEGVWYHVENKIPLANNIYRVHSEQFYSLFEKARELYQEGILNNLDSWDKELLETDIGKFAMYEGEKVPLDCPIEEEDEKNPPLNKPKEVTLKSFMCSSKTEIRLKRLHGAIQLV